MEGGQPLEMATLALHTRQPWKHSGRTAKTPTTCPSHWHPPSL